MNSKARSLSGALLMLVLIPIFAGLLACMPVPVGDPERSRIDPELTGVWVAVSGQEATIDESGIYVFEPYDKRTWLISGVGMGHGEDSDSSDYDLSTYKGFAEMAAAEPVNENHLHAESIVLYKAWIKKLGGELFMTWEPKVLLDDGIPEPEVWFVFRVVKGDSDSLQLRYVDGESDLFDDVKETRKAYEKVIGRNVDNPELYSDEGDDELFMTLVRVQESEMDFVENVFETISSWD